MRKIFYYTLGVSMVLLSACSKDKKIITKPGDTTVITASALDLIKDSVYLYSKETYLWYDALPDYKTFAPRAFTGSTAIAALTAEVDNLSQYKINPATNLPYEYYALDPGSAKYSFIDDGSVSGELGGTNGDFGFSIFYNNADHNDLRVKYVYGGSPADSANVMRGYRIIKINGSTNLDADVNANLDFVIKAIFQSKSINMTLQKPDNSQFNITLNTTSYNVNPVLKYKVFNLEGAKKVGYVVFNSFTVINNARPQLLKAFNAFSAAGITDLVVDLRYNGGGSVETAEYLDNLIVPSSKNGTQMFTYYYNDKLQADNHPLLSNLFDIPAGFFKSTSSLNSIKFAKDGSLNLSRVFFIVTGSTASASELTINNLRPIMDVKLIGRTTYGKPVGFFNIPLNNDKFELYMPNFSTKNSLNQGDYYAGMTPASTDYPGIMDNDDVTRNFGDSTEVLLSHALNFVKTGTFNLKSPKVQSASNPNAINDLKIIELTNKLDAHIFKGMINANNLQKRHRRQ